jgi:hypothetical protein
MGAWGKDIAAGETHGGPSLSTLPIWRPRCWPGSGIMACLVDFNSPSGDFPAGALTDYANIYETCAYGRRKAVRWRTRPTSWRQEIMKPPATLRQCLPATFLPLYAGRVADRSRQFCGQSPGIAALPGAAILGTAGGRGRRRRRSLRSPGPAALRQLVQQSSHLRGRRFPKSFAA